MGQRAIFFDIATRLSFSPILIATLILREKGYNKKDVRNIITNPDLIEDERIKNEIIKAIEVDIAYSPESF